MSKLISVPVFVEDSGETLMLQLSPEEVAKAKGKEINFDIMFVDYKNIFCIIISIFL